MYSIEKEFKFEAAHRLSKNEGKCRNIHGHNYKVKVKLTGKLDKNDMVMDFEHIGKIVNDILDFFDHSLMLNIVDQELIDLCIKNNWRFVTFDSDPTAEVIAIELFNCIPIKIQPLIDKITVYETDTSCGEYKNEKI